MATVESSSNSERDAKQGNDQKTKEARIAAIERMNEKMKGAGWRPLPTRGEVKKGIAKDVMDAVEGCVRTLKNSCTAPMHDENTVSLKEENGK